MTHIQFFSKINHMGYSYSRGNCHWAVFICFKHWRKILGASHLKMFMGCKQLWHSDWQNRTWNSVNRE